MFLRYRRTRFADEVRTDWAHALLYRPISLCAAYFLARTSATPLAVTLVGGLSIPTMAAAALLLDGAIAVPVVCLLACLGGVIDCVDGDLARQTGRTSRLGAYVDFQIDMVRWSTLYVATGVACDRALHGGVGAWTAVAVLAAWLRIFARSGRDFRAADGGVAPIAAPQPWSIARLAVAVVAGIDGLIPILLLAGWWAGAGGAIVLVPLVLAVLDVADTQISNFAHFRR